MSKKKMKMMTCPDCGWSVKSPFGENDIMDHAILHAKKHHPEVMKHDKADLKKMIKDT